MVVDFTMEFVLFPILSTGNIMVNSNASDQYMLDFLIVLRVISGILKSDVLYQQECIPF